MSSSFQSSFPSSSYQPSSTPSFLTPASTFSVPLHASSSAWKPTNWNLHSSAAKPAPRLKQRSPEENEIIKGTSGRVKHSLKEDHTLLNSNTETPFTDVLDVAHRLLPYHVLCQPREDRKGKRKAEDCLRVESKDTKFALECARRKRKLEERFRRARTRPGKRLAPHDQDISLEYAFAEGTREEIASLTSQLRLAKAELERIEREKRARLPQPPPQTTYQRTYPPYSYVQQPYGQTVFSAAPAVPSAGPIIIPIQLQRKMLPTLHAMNIYPVDAASIPPGAPQPPAILRSTSEDGETLNVEINSQLLQTVAGLATTLGGNR
ncbi:hypothetical protein C8F01DRAFT_237617 [Mycena amicta]|nr:hypothetical protein C8F01DRAFT_237617 [Mycena amicta]